jgi:catechol 2,3-dioxygenase-like lactoylglutathione lyase family enzyme
MWRPQSWREALPLILILAAPAPLRAQGPEAAGGVVASAVVTVGMTVDDMDRALDFYTGVLAFQTVADFERSGAEVEHLSGVFGAAQRVCRLTLGAETIELTDYLAPQSRPVPIDSRSNDRWFQHVAIITPDMAGAYQHLRRHKVRHASTGPQRLPDWNPSAGGIEAFYFHDPDGHVLEILAFPPGKGDPKWRRLAREHPGRLFLGIDHTAIVVADTDASLGFYQGVLGMVVAGTSENWGTEQEHLNNVFGARLRITSLRCASEGAAGPAIELLEYLAPQGGRPYPADARASDLVHWQTTVLVPDASRALAAARGAAAPLVSPGVVGAAGPDDGFARGLLLRDPDGHAMRLVEGPGVRAGR